MPSTRRLQGGTQSPGPPGVQQPLEPYSGDHGSTASAPRRSTSGYEPCSGDASREQAREEELRTVMRPVAAGGELRPGVQAGGGHPPTSLVGEVRSPRKPKQNSSSPVSQERSHSLERTSEKLTCYRWE